MALSRWSKMLVELESHLRRIIYSSIFLVFVGALTVHAQEQGNLVETLVKHWESSKKLTLAVANAMPEADYNFKATPSEMSFGEQMNHIAKANGNYCGGAQSVPNPLSTTPDNSKAAAQKNLDTAYDFCLSGLKKMTDSDLTKMVGKAPRRATVFEMFWGGFTHAAHHRGQAEVYLRLKGIKPPEYVF